MMFFLDENITTFLAIARFDQNIWCNCDDASQGQEILWESISHAVCLELGPLHVQKKQCKHEDAYTCSTATLSHSADVQ